MAQVLIRCPQQHYPYPTYTANGVAEIPFELIKPKMVGFDLDGTAALEGTDCLLWEAVEHIQQSLDKGAIGTACIISNARFAIFAKRVARLAQACQLPYLACYHPGPVKPNERAFVEACRIAGAEGFDRSDCYFVGNQFADLGARKYGYQTILVPTLGDVPWWKRHKLAKEERLRLSLGIRFPYEYACG